MAIVSEAWKSWKQRWTIYSKASGVAQKEEDVQCAILLHLIGADTLRIYNTFTFPTAEKDKIDPLVAKFEAHFNPRKNVTYERYLFNTCTQNGRPFDLFLIDIRNKSKSCEFSTLEDSLIKDRIVGV